jgi:hypothetical protein
MAHPVSQQHSLRRLFHTVTERSFLERLGWPDWDVVGYLGDLLTEYVHVDRLHQAHDSTGRQLVELIELLQEAEWRSRYESPEMERDLHRHIGDYTLFMTGLFPEGVKRVRRIIGGHPDALLDYVKVGKRSYRIVADSERATMRVGEGGHPPGDLFRRLSTEFELCVLGLGYVKQELQRLQVPPDARLRRFLPN